MKGIEADETAASGKSENSMLFWSNSVYLPVFTLTAASVTLLPKVVN